MIQGSVVAQTPDDSLKNHSCSAKQSWWIRDSKGRLICKVCALCVNAKLSTCKPEVRQDYDFRSSLLYLSNKESIKIKPFMRIHPLMRIIISSGFDKNVYIFRYLYNVFGSQKAAIDSLLLKKKAAEKSYSKGSTTRESSELLVSMTNYFIRKRKFRKLVRRLLAPVKPSNATPDDWLNAYRRLSKIAFAAHRKEIRRGRKRELEIRTKRNLKRKSKSSLFVCDYRKNRKALK